jgi:hypothetical protein
MPILPHPCRGPLRHNQGIALAQSRDGISFLTGDSWRRNINDALLFLKFSTENGSLDGQFVIACLAENGFPRDYQKQGVQEIQREVLQELLARPEKLQTAVKMSRKMEGSEKGTEKISSNSG